MNKAALFIYILASYRDIHGNIYEKSVHTAVLVAKRWPYTICPHPYVTFLPLPPDRTPIWQANP